MVPASVNERRLHVKAAAGPRHRYLRITRWYVGGIRMVRCGEFNATVCIATLIKRWQYADSDEVYRTKIRRINEAWIDMNNCMNEEYDTFIIFEEQTRLRATRESSIPIDIRTPEDLAREERADEGRSELPELEAAASRLYSVRVWYLSGRAGPFRASTKLATA
ncbi:hypothetical protein EVAR_60988_1 [Eumeta japonica]|uniref:Uncharacterized protein n=1 Tax=Eumeta variegata TaxID=151549 RepID=A0A4C1ZPP1_EUMVA|nr:hypothetical protein EVAR_60988_1 [Eumeta japonica]